MIVRRVRHAEHCLRNMDTYTLTYQCWLTCKNLRFFSFSFITQNLWKREWKISELHTQGPRYKSSVDPFFSSFCFRVETFLVILHPGSPRKFSWSHPLRPVACTWTRPFLACHCNLRSVSAKNTCVLFTLGTRCISCYFFFPGFDFHSFID